MHLTCSEVRHVTLSLYQRTPLHIVAREGHEHTLKYIVDNGALIDVQDYDGVRY